MNAVPYSYTTPPPGYRLPEEATLGGVRLQVSDLERSISYYQRVIGLRVIGKSPDHALLGALTGDRTLIELCQKPGVKPVPRRGRIGLYHFAILLPTRGALGSFLGHLASIGEQAGMSDHFVSEALYLTDPDGLGIEVYADRPRDSWTSNNSRLNIGTVDLNTADLLRAGSAGWEGVPAGTVIGHVHLHVDDLAKAESFYHDAAGFDKVNLEFPGALFMSAGGYHHHLGTNTWARGAPVATDDDARLLEWTVLVPSASDLDRLSASLAEKSFRLDRTSADVVATDPWGTNLRCKTLK